MPPPQYRVMIAGAVREQLQDVLANASARGQRADAQDAARKILAGLTWLADELGESRYPLNVFGELRVVVIGPGGAVFAVHAGRREVNVGRFRLLGVRRG